MAKEHYNGYIPGIAQQIEDDRREQEEYRKSHHPFHIILKELKRSFSEIKKLYNDENKDNQTKLNFITKSGWGLKSNNQNINSNPKNGWGTNEFFKLKANGKNSYVKLKPFKPNNNL